MFLLTFLLQLLSWRFHRKCQADFGCYKCKWVNTCDVISMNGGSGTNAFIVDSLSLFNPLMLAAAKSSLAILVKSFKQKEIWEKIWRRKVDQNTSNNSPLIFYENHSEFQSYCRKYERSRQHYVEELLSINGLILSLPNLKYLCSELGLSATGLSQKVKAPLLLANS